MYTYTKSSKIRKIERNGWKKEERDANTYTLDIK